MSEELIRRQDCLPGAVFAWQCWCPRCTADILNQHRSDLDGSKHYLPLEVRKKVLAAERTKSHQTN